MDLRSLAKTCNAVQFQSSVQDSEGPWAKAHDRSADPRPPTRRITQLHVRDEATAQKPLPPAGPVQLSNLVPGQASTQCLVQGDQSVLPGSDVAKKLVWSHTHTLPTRPTPPKPLWTTPAPCG
ncbi:hypothetical protein GCM10011576_09620 [Micromonospora parathelypteridis]|nr:hypothetical protein GCM10011576_09620 [Micromonospora parathelypteridis]